MFLLIQTWFKLSFKCQNNFVYTSFTNPRTILSSGKYTVKFFQILDNTGYSGILPDTGIRIRYTPDIICMLAKNDGKSETSAFGPTELYAFETGCIDACAIMSIEIAQVALKRTKLKSLKN